MNKLRKQLAKKPSFMQVYLTGHGNCLTNDAGLFLTVRLRPLSVALILQTKEMMGIVKKFKKISPDQVKQAEAQAKREIDEMSVEDQLNSVNEIISVGEYILQNYAVDAGYQAPAGKIFEEWAAESGDNSEDSIGLNEFFPVKFVATEEEKQRLESEDENVACILLSSLTDDEKVSTLTVLRNAAANISDSSDPIVEVEGTEEGGESELVSPKTLNTFPRSVR